MLIIDDDCHNDDGDDKTIAREKIQTRCKVFNWSAVNIHSMQHRMVKLNMDYKTALTLQYYSVTDQE